MEYPLLQGPAGLHSPLSRGLPAERNSAVYVLGRDFAYEKVDDQRMAYRGLRTTLEDVFVSLRGDHQLANGALALSAAECCLPSRLCLG